MNALLYRYIFCIAHVRVSTGKKKSGCFLTPSIYSKMTENEKLHLPNVFSFQCLVLDILVHQQEHDGTDFTVLLTS